MVSMKSSKKSKYKKNKFRFNIPSIFMKSRFSPKNVKNDVDEILPEENMKKIVVYVYCQDNIEHIDSLSVKERNEIINNIIELSRLKTFLQIKKDFIRHYMFQFFIIFMTIILALPLILIVVNKSYQLTINSYKTSEDNFKKLYNDRNIIIEKEKPHYVRYTK